jgi:hypothetical protein
VKRVGWKVNSFEFSNRICCLYSSFLRAMRASSVEERETERGAQRETETERERQRERERERGKEVKISQGSRHQERRTHGCTSVHVGCLQPPQSVLSLGVACPVVQDIVEVQHGTLPEALSQSKRPDDPLQMRRTCEEPQGSYSQGARGQTPAALQSIR